ncbi:MAG: hypothetical protein ACRDNW_26190, partial [Trebonia sp.]
MRGKAACERAFGAIQSLLFEQLPGYRGIDVADRGADPEGDAVLIARVASVMTLPLVAPRVLMAASVPAMAAATSAGSMARP